jgi:hypothetical protein
VGSWGRATASRPGCRRHRHFSNSELIRYWNTRAGHSKSLICVLTRNAHFISRRGPLKHKNPWGHMGACFPPITNQMTHPETYMCFCSHGGEMSVNVWFHVTSYAEGIRIILSRSNTFVCYLCITLM